MAVHGRRTQHHRAAMPSPERQEEVDANHIMGEPPHNWPATHTVTTRPLSPPLSGNSQQGPGAGNFNCKNNIY